MKIESWRYDIITKLLHWIIAILLIGLVALGWYMTSIDVQSTRTWYVNIHKSVGIIAGVLILLRFVWFFTHKSAPHPINTPHWQAQIAKLIHWLLYACMILMPLTGFLGSSFSKRGIAFFGLTLPKWVNTSHVIAEQLFNLHGIIAWVLVVLIALHVLAALKHLIIDKDDVFRRMWF